MDVWTFHPKLPSLATGSFGLKATDKQIVEKLQVLSLPKRTESVTGNSEIPQHGAMGISINPPTSPSTLILLQTILSHKLFIYCSGCRNQVSKLLLELLISSGCLPCAWGICVNKLIFFINLLLQGSRIKWVEWIFSLLHTGVQLCSKALVRCPSCCSWGSCVLLQTCTLWGYLTSSLLDH